MDDLPEEVSTARERVTLRSPPRMKQGPPKERNLSRTMDMKPPWSWFGPYTLATVKIEELDFSLRKRKRPEGSV